MRPREIERLDALLGASMIAHEAIFDMCRELIANERGPTEQNPLLKESAWIVTEALPNMTSTVRALAGRWSEQSLLAPAAAENTLRHLATEMERIEPELEALFRRQRQIAAQLRELLEN